MTLSNASFMSFPMGTIAAFTTAIGMTTASALKPRAYRPLRRWDFVSAYLQGSLEDGEVVYCHPPPGYERSDGDDNPLVCRVVKPIYGMAQAGRRWQRSLFPWLKKFGFTQCDYDSCMFHMTRGEEKLYVGCYVDDLAIAYGSDAEGSLYHDFTRALKAWQVEDEGEMHDLLGVEFSNINGVVELKQSAYISKLVETYLPDGVPDSFQSNKRPCSSDLPQLVADALSTAPKNGATMTFVLIKVSSVPSFTALLTLARTLPTRSECFAVRWRNPLPHSWPRPSVHSCISTVPATSAYATSATGPTSTA